MGILKKSILWSLKPWYIERMELLVALIFLYFTKGKERNLYSWIDEMQNFRLMANTVDGRSVPLKSITNLKSMLQTGFYLALMSLYWFILTPYPSFRILVLIVKQTLIIQFVKVLQKLLHAISIYCFKSIVLLNSIS